MTERPDMRLRTDYEAAVAERSRSSGPWSLHHLRSCVLLLCVEGFVLAVIGGIVAGPRAVLGVVVGTVVVGLFFTASALAIARFGSRSPKLVMPVALGSYLAKVIALGIVLVALPRDGAIDTRWMALAIAIGVFVWLGAHLRYVLTNKIYYVDPH